MFANVKLVMVQIGRGKDKTNRQLVPIMVLQGADGPVITGLETCNCTQLWVQRSKFGEAGRWVPAEARTAQTSLFAHSISGFSLRGFAPLQTIILGC